MKFYNACCKKTFPYLSSFWSLVYHASKQLEAPEVQLLWKKSEESLQFRRNQEISLLWSSTQTALTTFVSSEVSKEIFFHQILTKIKQFHLIYEAFFLERMRKRLFSLYFYLHGIFLQKNHRDVKRSTVSCKPPLERKWRGGEVTEQSRWTNLTMEEMLGLYR